MKSVRCWCLCFVLQFVFPGCLSYNIFAITRKSGIIQPQEDKFTVSNRYCYNNVPKCELFKASREPSGQEKPCTCVCKDGMRTRTTFAYHNKSWNCVDNSLFRATEGCARQHLFPREKSSDGLRILPASGHSESLGVHNNHRISYSINHYNSYLYECDGSWSRLRKVAEKFEIELSTINNGSNWMYHLKVKKQNHTSLTGRVIKLGLDYSDVTGTHENCLLFKLSGTTKCRDETIELLPLAPETTKPPTVHTTKIYNPEQSQLPSLVMESVNTRNKHAEHDGQGKGRGYMSFGFIAIGVVLSAVLLVGLPFMCCRKPGSNYDSKNKDNHKDSEDKGDLSNSYSEIDLNKNLGDQDCQQARSQRLQDGRSVPVRVTKSLGDLSVYDNYMPHLRAVPPHVDQDLTVSGRDDHLPSDNESSVDGYPDYHVLEGPDPNAPSSSDVLFQERCHQHELAV